jgi:hypothetical protein
MYSLLVMMHLYLSGEINTQLGDWCQYEQEDELGPG